MSDLVDAPLRYSTVIDSDKIATIKQEFKLSDGEVVKLEIPKFNNESDEYLLLTLREFNDMTVTYDLFTLLNGSKVYDRFRRCLSGDALDTWNGLIVGKTKDSTNFKTAQLELVETLIGDEAHDDQVEYLKDTRKPHDMDVSKWIQRMKTINSYLPTLKDGASSLTEVQLVKIITKNVPKAWKTQFKLADGHKSRTTIEALKKLRMLEKEEKHEKQIKLKARETGHQKRNAGSSGKIFNNKCTRCKDDEHEWFDCPKYNKNSKVYKAREAAELSQESHALESSTHEREIDFTDDDSR